VKNYPTMKKFINSLFFLLLTLNIHSQCNSWENYPDGKDEAVKLHVIYRDKIKQKNYKDAYPIWKDLYNTVQIPTPNKKTHFLDGIEMSLYFAKNDTSNKEKWLEQVDKIHSDYYRCVGFDPYQKGWQAYYMLQNNWKLEESFKIMKTVIDCGVDSIPAMTISHISRLGTYLYNQKKLESKEMLQILKRLEFVVNSKIKGKDSIQVKKYWEDAKTQFNTIQDIFDCEWWKEKFSKDSLTFENLLKYKKRIFEKCGSEDSIYKDISKRIFEIKKNLIIEEELTIVSKDTTTIWRKILAYRNLQEYDTLYKDKYQKEESELYSKLDLSEREWISDEMRSSELYRWAFKLYQSNKLVMSRDFCRSASRWCPNWGDPYILTGILYIENLNVESFESRFSVWVAIDEWNKAKRFDPNCTERANSYIKNYSKYLPTKTELFQRGISEGTMITVGGWIQQNTRVWSL
jgi:hypothetical protein